MPIILIVDDSLVIRMQFERLINELTSEYRCEGAGSGEEALKLAEKHRSELAIAIVDYNMNGMDGIALVENLKPFLPPQKTVIFSANIQNALKARADEKGSHFIPKPLNKEKLQEIFKLTKLKLDPSKMKK